MVSRPNKKSVFHSKACAGDHGLHGKETHPGPDPGGVRHGRLQELLPVRRPWQRGSAHQRLRRGDPELRLRCLRQPVLPLPDGQQSIPAAPLEGRENLHSLRPIQRKDSLPEGGLSFFVHLQKTNGNPVTFTGVCRTPMPVARLRKHRTTACLGRDHGA